VPLAEPILVGQLVAITSTGAVVADNNDASRLPAAGFAVVVGPTDVYLTNVGPVYNLAGLNQGLVYYLGSTGAATATAPSGVVISQTVGVAADSTSIFANVSPFGIYYP
jgi:hypothetical protein